MARTFLLAAQTNPCPIIGGQCEFIFFHWLIPMAVLGITLTYFFSKVFPEPKWSKSAAQISFLAVMISLCNWVLLNLYEYVLIVSGADI